LRKRSRAKIPRGLELTEPVFGFAKKRGRRRSPHTCSVVTGRWGRRVETNEHRNRRRKRERRRKPKSTELKKGKKGLDYRFSPKISQTKPTFLGGRGVVPPKLADAWESDCRNNNSP